MSIDEFKQASKIDITDTLLKKLTLENVFTENGGVQ
jgi:hypothetical protein